VRFQLIFDTALDPRQALRSLTGLRLEMLEHFPELDRSIRTFEAWQEEILNYFEAGSRAGWWRGSTTRRG
jgi:hypothetical protein